MHSSSAEPSPSDSFAGRGPLHRGSGRRSRRRDRTRHAADRRM